MKRMHPVSRSNSPVRLLVMGCVFAFGTAVVVPRIACAEQAATQKSDQSAAANFMTPQTQQSQNMAAAEQEDDEAVYKKSSSVRAIGRMLHLSPQASSVAFEDFNFVLLAGIILFYAAKLLPGFFRGRQQELDKHLTEARVATEEANERLQAVEERLGRLDQEIEQLRAKAEHDGAADEHRIKDSIEEERRKIVTSAEQEIAAMASTAERNLRKFGAEIAIARASGKLQLSEADDRTLVQNFGTSLVPDLDRRRN